MARTDLATSAEVIRAAGFNTAEEAGGDDVIADAIQIAEERVAGSFDYPAKRSRFVVDNTNTTYEFRHDNRKTYRIDHLIIRDDDNGRVEYSEDTTASESSQTFTFDNEFNTVTFAQATVNEWNGHYCEITYVPEAYHRLIVVRAAEWILSRSNIISTQEDSPTLLINLRSVAKSLEIALTSSIVVGSEDEKYYDPTLGKYITQRRFYEY